MYDEINQQTRMFLYNLTNFQKMLDFSPRSLKDRDSNETAERFRNVIKACNSVIKAIAGFISL